MKGGAVLVFIILLQLGTADVWGDLWKKVRITAKDESSRVLEKVDKEIGRWQKKLNEAKEKEKDEPPPPQPPVVEPPLPTPSPTPPPSPTITTMTTTEFPLPVVTSPQVYHSVAHSSQPETSAPTAATTTELASIQPNSTLHWTIGIISLIFVGFGAFFSVVLLVVRWYRRRHPSVPPFPPPDPPRILVERVYAPYLRMNEDRSLGESEYSSIGIEPVITESPT